MSQAKPKKIAFDRPRSGLGLKKNHRPGSGMSKPSLACSQPYLHGTKDTNTIFFSLRRFKHKYNMFGRLKMRYAIPFL
jgi:hypothetical protein